MQTVKVIIEMPKELYDELINSSIEQEISLTKLFRKFIKLGLQAITLQKSPDTALIIREGDTERELLI